MKDKIIEEVNNILKENKLTRKGIYENLLSKGCVKPNSEKMVYEILEYGLDNGLIIPSKIIKFRKKKGKLPSIFSMDQLTKIFDELERPKLAICVWLGFFCGMRISEVCKLKVEDVNLETKTIFIRNSKNTNRYKEGYGKDRVVDVPEIAIPIIKRWLEIISGGNFFLPSMQDPNKPIRSKTIHEQYRALLKKCNLNQKESITSFRAKNHGKKKDLERTTYKYRFHTLRHTYATYLLDKGVPIENIQRCLGHNQIDTTLIYAKVRDTKTKEMINQAFETPLRLINNTIQTPKQEPIKQVIEGEPEDILKKRLARGEIDILTYKQLISELNPDKDTINVILKEKN